MDPETTATLGEPDFPPKNGIIIKQGYLFVQETKKLLFMKWKVWRKRLITLRYLSKHNGPVLEIDSRNGSCSPQILTHLSCSSAVEIIDYSGPQDLASAKALQVIPKEKEEPLIFKHASQDEMTEWVAAFKLTIALGETGSICSDTDSSTWAGSLSGSMFHAAASPVADLPDAPNMSFVIGDAPISYPVIVISCNIPSHQDLLINHEYNLQLSHHGIVLLEKSGDVPSVGTRHWPLAAVKQVMLQGSQEESSATRDVVQIEISRPSKHEDGFLVVRTSMAADLCQRASFVSAASLGARLSLKDRFQNGSTKSRGALKRPVSERCTRRPMIGQIRQHSSKLSSFEQSPPNSARSRRRTPSREDSVRALRNRRIMAHFKQMDSRDSTTSSNEYPSGGESVHNIAMSNVHGAVRKPPLLAQLSFGATC